MSLVSAFARIYDCPASTGHRARIPVTSWATIAPMRAPRHGEHAGIASEAPNAASDGVSSQLSGRRRSRIGRWLVRLGTTLAVAYVLVVFAFFVLQERLVFPASKELRHLDSELELAHEELMLATRDGEHIHARWVPSSQAIGSVIYFHGNGGNLGDAHPIARRFSSLNVNVLLVDYRGYGLSSGVPSEAGLYIDARTAYDYLTQERHITSDKIVIHGRSLGGGVSVQLASEVPCAGVILESTFTRLSDVAAEHYPWLPISLLLRPRFDSIDKIASIRAPILIAHSAQDTLIPISQAEEMIHAAPAGTRFLPLRGDHNETATATGSSYEAGLREFLVSVLTSPSSNSH